MEPNPSIIATSANFAAVGARFGLRPSAPIPGYGLAEATLAVSFGAPHDPPIVDTGLPAGCHGGTPRAAGSG